MDDTSFTLGVGRRDYKDRRPGTPVPFHEPDPNRHALSDAIRARIEKEAAEKLQRSVAYQRQQGRRDEANGKQAKEIKPRRTMAETLAATIIPFPPHPERAVPKGTGEIRATRDGETLFFTSISEAAAAFTSKALSAEDRYTCEVRYSTVIGSYLRAGDGVAEVFGWKWERLANRPARTRTNGKKA